MKLFLKKLCKLVQIILSYLNMVNFLIVLLLESLDQYLYLGNRPPTQILILIRNIQQWKKLPEKKADELDQSIFRGKLKHFYKDLANS